MCSKCDHCGYKSNDVKGGGAISSKAQRTILRVTKPEDLNRDILKSDTATLEIPEKRLKVTRGTMGGKFTTIEGILDGIKEDLLRADPFVGGDSGQEEKRQKFKMLLSGLDELMTGKQHFTIIMEDPVSNR